MAATRSNVVGGSDYTSGANREDLQNFITLTSADKTPFLSMLKTGKATNARHEWATQSLAAPNATSQSTSFEFATGNNVDQTVTRMSNYVETMGKTIHIDGLQMKSKSIGEAKDWFQNTVNIRKLELRRDIEDRVIGSWDDEDSDMRVYDSGNTPRMASLYAYAGIWNRLPTAALELNDDTVLTTTAGTAVDIIENGLSGAADTPANRAKLAVGSHCPQFAAAPTAVALSEEHINSSLQVGSETGGMYNVAMVPTGLKRAVSQLLIAGNGGAAERRASEMAKRVNLAVDSVLTEFGYDLSIVHNYIMQSQGADSNVVFFNTDSVERTVMQPYTMEMDGTARFGKGGIIFCAETLTVKNPKDVSVIAGATTA